VNGTGHSWRIDPAPAAAGALPLFPPGGEHERALLRLFAEPAARRLPDEVLLHLHAYELLERLRELGDRDQLRLWFPFWPESLFAAAGVRAHAAVELHACMPVPAAVTCAMPPDAVLQLAAQRLLGDLCFDPQHYRWSLRACARRHGFAVDEVLPTPEPPPIPAAGAHLVVGAVLLRNGHLLLERRPDDAAVYAGVWDTPGGHVEPGETPAAALVRELREELGIEARQPEPLGEQYDRDPTSGRSYRHLAFVVTTWRGSVTARLGQRLCWMPVTDVLRLHRINPLVRQLLVQLLDAGRLSP